MNFFSLDADQSNFLCVQPTIYHMPHKNPEKRREYQRKYMQTWYENNKATHISYVRNGQKKIKAWLSEYKKCVSCEVCGKRTIKLRFQHRDPQSRKFYVSDIRDCPSLGALKEEIAKCRALCTACFYRLNYDPDVVDANGPSVPIEPRLKTHERISQQLGMSSGKASHRLKKIILLDVLRRHQENICFRCRRFIETVEELSVEHKLPWLDVSPELFWDLSNIAFSHLRCNRPDRPISERWKKKGPEGTAWCSRCRSFLPVELFLKSGRRWNRLSDECSPCHTKRLGASRRRKQFKDPRARLIEQTT